MKQLIVPTFKLHKKVYNEILKSHTKWVKENSVSDKNQTKTQVSKMSTRKIPFGNCEGIILESHFSKAFLKEKYFSNQKSLGARKSRIFHHFSPKIMLSY